VFSSRQGQWRNCFLFATSSRPALEPLLSNGYRGLLPRGGGVKWLGHEADRTPSFNAEVKNVWSYTSTHSYMFMTWCLDKHRDFTFSFSYPIGCQCNQKSGQIIHGDDYVVSVCNGFDYRQDTCTGRGTSRPQVSAPVRR
jgi:hypothetical protein